MSALGSPSVTSDSAATATVWTPSASRGVVRSLVADGWRLGLIGLALFAFVLRIAFADQQSAYMDEGTNVLTGRLLVEEQTVYAEILNWAYGSYLWPLIAGLADAAGGLALVRAVTAACGVAMVLGTALAAHRLAPPGATRTERRAIALLAGAAMAIAPTAIGLGRFATYDGLAAAGFMLGGALLLPTGGRARPLELLAAALLLFVAFLAKYLVAIYFPLICLGLMLAPLAGRPRRWSQTLAHTLWLVVPLTAACAAYLLVFLSPLVTLLTASMHYGDLKSDHPLYEYVWSRPEIWLLIGAAALGWRAATRTGRLVAVVGAGLMVGFQVQARPDFDFWKHSVYLIYFLAPLAALNWLRVQQNTGTWRVVGVAVPVAAMLWLSPRVEGAANEAAAFYPNLHPSLDAIATHTAGAATVLMDDTAVRYYLYRKVPMDGLIGPFAFSYYGQPGIDGYRTAISDHYFDVIVLDGGVTPQGAAIQANLQREIEENYTRVYSAPAGRGFAVDIYKPTSAHDTSGGPGGTGPWPVRYTFEGPAMLERWGAHPESGEMEPGRQVTISSELPWAGLPSLQFEAQDRASTVTVQEPGTVSAVRAHVYVTPGNEGGAAVRIGMMGFDADWTWRDDGYRWLIPSNTWTTIKWQLARPGLYHEIGLNFPRDVKAAYIGDLEIDP